MIKKTILALALSVSALCEATATDTNPYMGNLSARHRQTLYTRFSRRPRNRKIVYAVYGCIKEGVSK